MLQQKTYSSLINCVVKVARKLVYLDNTDQIYKEGLALLRSTLEQTIGLNITHEFGDVHYPKGYVGSLQSAMDPDKIELFNILLDFLPGAGSGDPTIYLKLQKERFNPVPGAAGRMGLDFLKSLLQRGFSINEPTQMKLPMGLSYAITALSEALQTGDMKILTYILQEGADIYAPCGSISSAVGHAVLDGRIDAVALLLAVEPDCYEIALREAIAYSRGYMEDYLRKWKEELDSDRMIDFGGDVFMSLP
ncbi:hypothetical protein TWF281_004577 [Arthrobotrys megalospora]